MSICRIAYSMLLFLLIFITIAVCSGVNIPGDVALNGWIVSIQTPFLDTSMPVISYLGAFPYCIIISIIFGLLFWLNRRYIESLFIVSVPYIGVCVSYTLKFLIDKPRPLEGAGDNSFPSGHTIFVFILMGIVIYFIPLIVKSKSYRISLQIAAGLLILLMGFSRIYLQLHWLSDVVSGLIIGTLIFIPAIILYKRIIERGIRCPNSPKSKP